jgi:hypothetical protein
VASGLPSSKQTRPIIETLHTSAACKPKEEKINTVATRVLVASLFIIKIPFPKINK